TRIKSNQPDTEKQIMRRCSPSPRGASARAPCRTSPAPTERYTSSQRVGWVTMEEEEEVSKGCALLCSPLLWLWEDVGLEREGVGGVL
uniref:Uncharacterized protein n=1 Tax=Aegilops tauschii subsp. strangulata TaxID=200361 RepID=A0A453QN94_AEGTS